MSLESQRVWCEKYGPGTALKEHGQELEVAFDWKGVRAVPVQEVRPYTPPKRPARPPRSVVRLGQVNGTHLYLVN
jgi:hypothetical protein